MKRIFLFLLVFTLLATVFCGTTVGAVSKKTVSLTGEIIKVNPGAPYNRDMLALKSDEGVYVLLGSIANKEEYLNNTVSIKGIVFNGPQDILMLHVKSYEVIDKAAPTPDQPKPTQTPVTIVTQLPTRAPDYVELKGILYNGHSSEIRFLLRTENGPYELMGNTKGLENEFGNTLVVTGNYVYTLLPTEFPLFSVESYRVVDYSPTPTPTLPAPTASSARIITIEDNGGYVFIQKGDEVKLVLESNKTTGYCWEYIEKPDPRVLVQTNYEYILDSASEEMVGVGGKEVWTYKALENGTVVIRMAYSRPWSSETPYRTFAVKVIVGELPTTKPTPTITPEYQVIEGTLIVTKVEPPPSPVAYFVPPYKFELKTDKGLVTLQGKTAGMEKYDGMRVSVKGTYSPLDIYPPIFIVEAYKPLVEPTSTPELTFITGSLNVTLIKTEPPQYKFELKTERGPVSLQGNTTGLEKYNGADIAAAGNYSPLTIYPPIFIVEYYKPLIAPTPTPTTTTKPTPTSEPVSKVHTVTSEEILFLSVPGIGSVGNPGAIKGFTTASWDEGTNRAFFSAKFETSGIYFEVELIAVESTDCDSIKGLFNFKKNGELVLKEIPGELYGLSLPTGEYFKFYSADSNWHMSAYITNRLDF